MESNVKFRCYTSCNCRACRRASSKEKRFHKRMAHRALRRKKLSIIKISTGYKD